MILYHIKMYYCTLSSCVTMYLRYITDREHERSEYVDWRENNIEQQDAQVQLMDLLQDSKQRNCMLTWTNENVPDVIRTNFHDQTKWDSTREHIWVFTYDYDSLSLFTRVNWGTSWTKFEIFTEENKSLCYVLLLTW